MTSNLVVCQQDTTLKDVASLMAQYDCGAVPVIESEKSRKIVGIITDRDIVCRALAKGLDPSSAMVGECMTTRVFVANELDPIERCIELMESHRVRRIPIVDKNRYCTGIVTQTDVAQCVSEKKLGHAIRVIESENLDYLVPGNDPKSKGERYIYGGVRPELTAPTILPTDIHRNLPPEASTLYYNAYQDAYVNVMDDEGRDEGEIKKDCDKAAMAAVEKRFRKDGDRWVPKS